MLGMWAVTHWNGTQGMWVGDSSEWHVWYAGAWLTATARMACGRADSLQWHAWYADAWLTAKARMACGRADSLQWHARNVEL